MSTTTRRLASPKFLTCALLLGAAAVGLSGAMGAVAERMSKKPIDIRVPLASFDVSQMPNFIAVDPTEFTMDVEAQEIGTDEAMTIPLSEIDANGNRIGRQMMLHAAYYDGTSLAVSHTPEVCYRQGGATILGFETVTVPTPNLPGHESVNARLVDLRVAGGQTIVVLYLFVSNGEYYHDREALRFALFKPWGSAPRVYFTKFEVTVGYHDEYPKDVAVAALKRAMAEGLPILVADHMPTEEALNQR